MEKPSFFLIFLIFGHFGPRKTIKGSPKAAFDAICALRAETILHWDDSHNSISHHHPSHIGSSTRIGGLAAKSLCRIIIPSFRTGESAYD